jgi:hypothetical protein
MYETIPSSHIDPHIIPLRFDFVDQPSRDALLPSFAWEPNRVPLCLRRVPIDLPADKVCFDTRGKLSDVRADGLQIFVIFGERGAAALHYQVVGAGDLHGRLYEGTPRDAVLEPPQSVSAGPVIKGQTYDNGKIGDRIAPAKPHFATEDSEFPTEAVNGR